LEIARPSVQMAFSCVDSQLSTSTASVRTISDHASYMVAVINRIVDGEEEAIEGLKEVGACHAKLREHFFITGDDFEILGQLLAETFLKLEGIRQSKEAGQRTIEPRAQKKLWRLLIASVIDHLRAGFEAEWRIQQRHRMSPRASIPSASELFKMRDERLDTSSNRLKGSPIRTVHPKLRYHLLP
uniref:GLOBIN domain-containing protein n=1 Tax=Gongylonema pulchrum TaxID=637853 RepID=A0A183DCR1_9BILA